MPEHLPRPSPRSDDLSCDDICNEHHEDCDSECIHISGHIRSCWITAGNTRDQAELIRRVLAETDAKATWRQDPDGSPGSVESPTARLYQPEVAALTHEFDQAVLRLVEQYYGRLPDAAIANVFQIHTFAVMHANFANMINKGIHPSLDIQSGNEENN